MLWQGFGSKIKPHKPLRNCISAQIRLRTPKIRNLIAPSSLYLSPPTQRAQPACQTSLCLELPNDLEAPTVRSWPLKASAGHLEALSFQVFSSTDLESLAKCENSFSGPVDHRHGDPACQALSSGQCSEGFGVSSPSQAQSPGSSHEPSAAAAMGEAFKAPVGSSAMSGTSASSRGGSDRARTSRSQHFKETSMKVFLHGTA